MSNPNTAYEITKLYESNLQSNIIFITSNEKQAKYSYEYLKFIKPNLNILYLPNLDISPYEIVPPSKVILALRAEIFSKLINDKHYILVLSVQNLIRKIHPKTSLTNSKLKLKLQDDCNLDIISKKLISLGFSRTETAFTSSEFSIKGEIIDIVTAKFACRIQLAWNKIETIKILDVTDQTSTKETLTNITLYPATEIILSSEMIKNFQNSIKLNNLPPHHPACEAIQNSCYHHALHHLIPLFFTKTANIIDYVDNPTIILNGLALISLSQYKNTIEKLYENQVSNNKESIYLKPELLFFKLDEVKLLIKNHQTHLLKDNKNTVDQYIQTILSSNKNTEDKLNTILTEYALYKIIICSEDKEIFFKLQSYINNEYLDKDIKWKIIKYLPDAKVNQINFVLMDIDTTHILNNNIFIPLKNLAPKLITDKSQHNSKKKLKKILAEMDSFRVGELIVHDYYGIGRFEGIETLEIQEAKHDCLKLLYANDDKLFVPVENCNLIKKYGYENAALDKLGSINWEKRKATQKNYICEIAKDLVELAAQRKLANITPIDIDENKYQQFCSEFPYKLTLGQLETIEQIKQDFLKNQLANRLICGDVGFGKTETAIHAIFMILSSIAKYQRQVALICPTTLLCRQHYNNIKKRLINWNFNIVEISRLTPKKTIIDNQKLIKTGEADIIIGTHALLNEKFKFCNLKLLIIDEEQKFGVKQKTLLKKINTHVISLSATPIPRTLQMSLTEIQDLSLITTPPANRLPIKTLVSKYNLQEIKDAILYEMKRGGQIFFICPYISDLNKIHKELIELIPKLKIKIIHSQINNIELDKIMMQFSQGQFDLLLATSIVASGIDIANANTMIIYKAENFGLSQLYQLRGRIGRRNIQAYAYLLVRENLSKSALKRLEVIGSTTELGSGFIIASHDLEIRGCGNLLGKEQAGHIKEIGISLYQEMLEEAINKINNNKLTNNNKTANIKINIPVLIPENYITDKALRLGLYNRISELSCDQEIKEFFYEMNDRFGKVPQELDNLLQVVSLKNMCKKLNIKQIESGDSGMVIKFFPENIKLENILMFVNSNKDVKLRQDDSLVVKKTIAKNNVIGEIKSVLNKLYNVNYITFS